MSTISGPAPDSSTGVGAARTIGGYRLERPLGRGGTAEVWLGRHEVSNGLAAIKILKAEQTEVARRLFDNERRAVLRLRHPNIVPVFDVGEDYIATAYVEGVDLRHRIRSPMAPYEAIEIACAIGSALAGAHARDVVHCDVKPANILLDRNGTPFLADFGIARMLEDERGDDGVRAGTPQFMAPEQVDGEALPQSDQYSLARTLLAMLVGQRLPFLPSDALALLPDGLEDLGAVLERAMAMAPRARFETMDDFVAALRAIEVTDDHAVARLAPLAGDVASFAWAGHPHRVETIGESITRADYLLSEIVDAGLVDRARARAFRDKTGYADFGWSIYGRSDRLGPVHTPEALARVSESVVFLHGLFASREVWRDVAVGVARDNGLAIAITPDLMGCGASVCSNDAPDSAISPAGVVRGMNEWLSLIGLVGTQTVVIGHSYTSTALLCVRDEELGEGIHRVCITPVFFFQRLVLRTYMRINSALAFVASVLPGTLWHWLVRLVFRYDPSLKKARAEARNKMADTAIRLGMRRVSRLFRFLAIARPASADQLVRCTILTTPDDPYVPVDLAEESIGAAGIGSLQWFRLLYGGHFPQLLDDEHPEWGARNVHELVSVVDSVIDMTRTSSRSSDAHQDQTRSRVQEGDAHRTADDPTAVLHGSSEESGSRA